MSIHAHNSWKTNKYIRNVKNNMTGWHMKKLPIKFVTMQFVKGNQFIPIMFWSSLTLTVSLVNVNKFTISCGFIHIYLRNCKQKNYFLCSANFFGFYCCVLFWDSLARHNRLCQTNADKFLKLKAYLTLKSWQNVP